MVNTFIDGLRAAVDNGLQTVAATSLSNYKAYLVQITDDTVNFDDSAAGRVRTDTRITVGVGYLSYAPYDGYLNPHVQFISPYSSETMVLSGAALTDIDAIMGPLVYSYNLSYQTGGLEPSLFQPGPTAAANTQIYVHLYGEGLNLINGNYFKVREIVIGGMDNTFFYVRLSAISDVIP